MKVELIELTENRIRFLLQGVSPAFANGIRRACLSEVATLAVDEISIYDNTSVLFDEMLALRMGLVPLIAEDLDQYSSPEDCTCAGAGCPGCRVDFMLTSEGPGMVYSRDMIFNDPGVKVAYETVPLVSLGEGEKLVVEGYATKRPGSSHSKWLAGTVCGYKNLPQIQIRECSGCGKCVEVCPRKVLALGDDQKVVVRDQLACSLCKLCIKECEEGAIDVGPIPDSFVFNIEGDGSIKAKDLVAKAAEEIRHRAETLGSKLAEFS